MNQEIAIDSLTFFYLMNPKPNAALYYWEAFLSRIAQIKATLVTGLGILLFVEIFDTPDGLYVTQIWQNSQNLHTHTFRFTTRI